MPRRWTLSSSTRPIRTSPASGSQNRVHDFAVGLTALGPRAKPAEKALLAATKDAAPNVRIAAADALCNLGREDHALAVLIAGLQHASPFIRLRAMNALDRIGPRARPALAAMRKARPAQKGHVAGYVGRMVQYVPPKLQK